MAAPMSSRRSGTLARKRSQARRMPSAASSSMSISTSASISSSTWSSCSMRRVSLPGHERRPACRALQTSGQFDERGTDDDDEQHGQDAKDQGEDDLHRQLHGPLLGPEPALLP